MQFTTLLTAISALALGASASPIARDAHISDFRLFGEKGCSADNEGIWTVLHSDLDKCTGFNGESVKSILLGDINDGCKLWVYSDSKCSTGKTHALTSKCTNASKKFKSWKLKCSE